MHEIRIRNEWNFFDFRKKKDKTTRFFNIVSIFYGIIRNKIACLNAIDRT